eukprot:369268-Prymnesium_polylepis.1
MSAEQVERMFRENLGPPEECFERMCKMDLGELEELQGMADDINAGGSTPEAQKCGLDWSVRIGRVIA